MIGGFYVKLNYAGTGLQVCGVDAVFTLVQDLEYFFTALVVAALLL